MERVNARWKSRGIIINEKFWARKINKNGEKGAE